VFLFRRFEITLLAVIVTTIILVQLCIAPQTRHHGRYLFPQLPLILLMAAIAFDRLRDSLPQKLVVALPIALFALSILSTARWSYLAASDVRNINDQHLAAANWLTQNHRERDVIAAGDVGAIGYLTGETIVDPNGLITPSAWDARSDPDSLWHTLRSKGANVFVIYPRWNRSFFARYQDSLVLRGRFSVRLPLTASADTTLDLYRLREHGS
jgi:hypothetical protein